MIVAKEEELSTCKAKLVTLDKHVEELKAQVKLCMTAIANGGAVQVTPASKVNAPKPPTYSGARCAREIDNFLWGLEAHFGAMGIMKEAQKLSNASLFLKDIALVWWRRRNDNVRRGANAIDMWEAFKGELKRQFYPEDAE